MMKRRRFLKGLASVPVVALIPKLPWPGDITGFGLTSLKPEGAAIVYDSIITQGSEARLLQAGIDSLTAADYRKLI